ncbi:hypothetical protein CTAM01_14357 [Colletotrichum tamarilloi]|uniref:Uncharacterized protein n=1 Tax=Colletotrichum tamarilloi TaxID=1209934 RepID=A0ABQ9QPI5_9PEZI|nr:uncharacterized protein CTAM01_14357 [Colletotrichum tamarilloi]KAK1480517.1 hypothetical protein CTAM01_14357 [Colletotrichum tamarilloi]
MEQENEVKPFTDIRDVLYHWIQNDGATKNNGLLSYTNLRVTREDGVYDGNTQRSDLVLEGSGIRTIIELKCERGDVPSPKWIVDEVIKDAGKLQQTLKDKFRPVICYAVGIAATKDADKEIQNAFNASRIPRTGFYCKDSKIYVF